MKGLTKTVPLKPIGTTIRHGSVRAAQSDFHGISSLFFSIYLTENKWKNYRHLADFQHPK
jgi:hypothetical protein